MATDYVTLLVIDVDETLVGSRVDDWDAITLLACLSDDPANWDDVRLIWPRYQTELCSEFVDSLPLQLCDLDEAMERLDSTLPWVAFDLVKKRVFSGGGYDELTSFETYGIDEDGKRICIPVRLCRSWEFYNDAEIDQIRRPLVESPTLRDPHREILWGEAWITSLADRLLAVAAADEWDAAYSATDRRDLYAMTVEVHKQWLMTPHSDLGGYTPRECLHIDREWLDSLIDARRFGRVSDRASVPLNSDTQAYKRSPMGTIEIVTYFDCNRALIERGWTWIADHRQSVDEGKRASELIKFLTTEKDTWLNKAEDDPETPADCILSERQRIPLISNGQSHILDCDCPICMTMSGGGFGPSFIMFDGHHLELDDEYAFSLTDDREEWEYQKDEFHNADEKVAVERNEPQTVMVSTATNLSEFDSAWENSYVNWDIIEGTPMEQMALSFLLADMVCSLQLTGNKKLEIKKLNAAFSEYRTQFLDAPAKATQKFKRALDKTAERNEDLVTRAADLQSKLDEICRRASK